MAQRTAHLRKDRLTLEVLEDRTAPSSSHELLAQFTVPWSGDHPAVTAHVKSVEHENISAKVKIDSDHDGFGLGKNWDLKALGSDDDDQGHAKSVSGRDKDKGADHLSHDLGHGQKVGQGRDDDSSLEKHSGKDADTPPNPSPISRDSDSNSVRPPVSSAVFGIHPTEPPGSAVSSTADLGNKKSSDDGPVDRMGAGGMLTTSGSHDTTPPSPQRSEPATTELNNSPQPDGPVPSGSPPPPAQAPNAAESIAAAIVAAVTPLGPTAVTIAATVPSQSAPTASPPAAARAEVPTGTSAEANPNPNPRADAAGTGGSTSVGEPPRVSIDLVQGDVAIPVADTPTETAKFAAPDVVGRLAELMPAAARSLEQNVQNFLEQIDHIGDRLLPAPEGRSYTLDWVVGMVAGLAAVGGWFSLRRRAARAGLTPLRLTDGTWNWWPDSQAPSSTDG